MSKPITNFDVNSLDALQALIWQYEMGADEAIADEPLDRFRASESLSRQGTMPGAMPPGAPRGTMSATGPLTAPGGRGTYGGAAAGRSSGPAGVGAGAGAAMPPAAIGGFVLSDTPSEARISAQKAASDAGTLEELHAALRAFEGCALKKSASNTVFGSGNPAADIVLVGEAPDADEDRQGAPFTGAAGKLLDAMLRSIGLSRETVYLTNILPWRPPGNRQPTADELMVCEPFVRRHIEMIGPRIVVCLGGSAAKTLMEQDKGITRLRGTWHEIAFSDSVQSDVTAMFHPSYLLKTPEQKRVAWQDLRGIVKKLRS
ncbi:uracil-DNA glycosylase [uncultured Thalassospira sp.]|jgi:DNA polymerase|uniref:uracil-DNA glycosylase n=1 Tax=uncultured Thalassospira sp. TaxID=404382 RepID=UPI0030D813D7|tara:strand:+ start:2837 stop:3784 length:948 start_codon:yes stop_codon:yes gene_type:complete